MDFLYELLVWAIKHPALSTLLLIAGLYYGFPIYAAVFRAWKTATMKEKLWFLPYAPLLIVIGVIDILVAIIVASSFFRERWTTKHATVSQYLCNHYDDDDYRGSFARALAIPINLMLPGHITSRKS